MDAVSAPRAHVETSAPPASRGRAIARLLFPGNRRVWLWALVALVPLAGVLGYELLKQRVYYTGTNSVVVNSLVVGVQAHQTLCMPRTDIPAGTAQVELAAGAPGPRPAIKLSITEAGKAIASGRLPAGPPQPLQGIIVPLAHTIASRGVGSVCLRTGAGGPLQLGGTAQLTAEEVSPTLDGQPIGNRVSLWFFPRPGATRSLVASWPDVMRRVALFRPGFAAPAFYWVLFVAGLPLLAYFALRLLALAGEPRRRIALGLALVAFASASTWALTTVAFDSPDEPEHFAYAQSIAETGRAPDPAPSARQPYAGDLVYALGAVRHFSTISSAEGRPPWFKDDVAQWRAEIARAHPARSDGGGYSSATAPHSPLYYSLLLPGYELGHSGGIFTELFWMRLISALLAVVVPLCVYGALRELAPSRPTLAVAGGLLAAFQPMFGFLSGSVNNDVGVDAAAALVAYLITRALRRGLPRALWLGLGIAVAVLPLMKGTGYELFPAIAVALAALIAVERSRPALLGLGLAIAAFAVATLGWGAIAGDFHRATVTTGGATSGAGGVTSLSQLGGHLTYLWETFLPRLPFMAQHFAAGLWPFYFIYVQRGFGAFGWYAIFFPGWVYVLIVSVMGLAGAGAVVAIARHWDAARARWREALFLLLIILAAVAGVAFYYYSPTPRPKQLTPEQGRYAFTAMLPLIALALCGLYGVSRRAALPVATVLVTAMIALSIGSRLLYLTNTFT
jgi:hypothetical protein